MFSERRRQKVGSPEKLPKLNLFQIDCPTTPTLHASVLKEGAKIEFEVTHQGQTNFYRGVASKPMDPVPAPPMPEGSIVRIRQGECELWSDWSDPQTANGLNRPVQKPKIVGNLFQCQNTVPGTASPMTLACRRDTLLLLGKSTGPQLPYTIG